MDDCAPTHSQSIIYAVDDGPCSDALGTVDRFGLTFQNQGVAKLKLLKVVDLTSYRVSTSAPAIPTGARGEQHPESSKIEPNEYLNLLRSGSEQLQFRLSGVTRRKSRSPSDLFYCPTVRANRTTSCPTCSWPPIHSYERTHQSYERTHQLRGPGAT